MRLLLTHGEASTLSSLDTAPGRGAQNDHKTPFCSMQMSHMVVKKSVLLVCSTKHVIKEVRGVCFSE